MGWDGTGWDQTKQEGFVFLLRIFCAAAAVLAALFAPLDIRHLGSGRLDQLRTETARKHPIISDARGHPHQQSTATILLIMHPLRAWEPTREQRRTRLPEPKEPSTSSPRVVCHAFNYPSIRFLGCFDDGGFTFAVHIFPSSSRLHCFTLSTHLATIDPTYIMHRKDVDASDDDLR